MIDYDLFVEDDQFVEDVHGKNHSINHSTIPYLLLDPS